MSAAVKLATYEDLLTMPDDVRAEIVGGMIQVLPAPRPRHSNVQGSLRRFVGGPFHDDDGFGGPGGWWIFVEVDIQLSRHDVVRPDLSGWRRERLPKPDARPVTVVPDWVCEIVSPTSGDRDRVAKRRLYAQSGVRHDWIVDPMVRTLEALELRGSEWVELGAWGDADTARIAPFEAIELPVGRLFLPKDASETPDE